MSGQIVEARLIPSVLRVKVWMDNLQTGNDGLPSPAYLREALYPGVPPSGLTQAQYLVKIQEDIQRLSTSELYKMQVQATQGQIVSALEGWTF